MEDYSRRNPVDQPKRRPSSK